MIEFGHELLRTNDLDPVYVVLHQAQLSTDELCRWLLPYWSFYHVGTASWIAEATSYDLYWNRMHQAAASKEYPRSAERRHFRGEFATKCVMWLENRGLDDLMTPLLDLASSRPSAKLVMDLVQKWYGFGEWISFKVADMLERLGLCPVQFDENGSDILLFDSPRKGAQLVFETYFPQGNRGVIQTDDPVRWGLEYVRSTLYNQGHRAPPTYDRLVGVQEAETVLCKYHSYYHGRYAVGKDIKEVRHSLLRFPKVRLCQRLLAAGKKGGLW